MMKTGVKVGQNSSSRAGAQQLSAAGIEYKTEYMVGDEPEFGSLKERCRSVPRRWHGRSRLPTSTRTRRLLLVSMGDG